MRFAPFILAHLSLPLRLEYLSIPAAAALFFALAIPVILLGAHSLNWLGATRKWVSISLRLSVIWVLVLLLAGAHWVRQSRNLDVMVLRDVSTSTSSVTPPPGKTLASAVDEMIRNGCKSKHADDRIGVIDFSHDATIESLPDDHPHLDSHAIDTGGDGTDISQGVRAALATFRQDAMRRLVLVSDGNATQGDTDAAITAAASMQIPIDVLPLHYQIQRDVMLDRMIAPTCARLNEPFTLDVILRSTSVSIVGGTVRVTQNGNPIESPHVELRAGANIVHVKIPAQSHAGLAEFRASFQADRAFDDALPGNNTAESFTFLRGTSQILFVDGEVPAATGAFLFALESAGIHPVQIAPTEFPTRPIDLQPYDAVLLSNVSRGPSGLNTQQDHLLAHYVRDLGGGLIVIGGPDAFGAGNWHGSELEKVLPVDCDINAQRVTPAGAIVIVLDHSGSMSEPMPGSTHTKQQLAAESAILAVESLQLDDHVGVIGFAQQPQWVTHLGPNRDPALTASRIRGISPTEGTNICPALNCACDALERINSSQIGAKRIILLTDGVSEPGDYDRVVSRCRASHISLSTIAIGPDADIPLLRQLADRGGGAMYAVDSANQLRNVFLREARMLRRPLIHEPAGGIALVQDLDDPMPSLGGIVLTSHKPDPTIHTSILAAGQYHDPILSSWSVGLGRATVFTSDITPRWASQWIASPNFARFWANQIRAVQRPPMSDTFDVRMTRDGAMTRMIVEVVDLDGAARSFIAFSGKLLGPEETTSDVHLEQTGPGRYEAILPTRHTGTYAAFMQYRDPAGKTGSLLAGISVPASVDMRDMQSNEAYMAEIASRTGGRVLQPLDHGGGASLFDREGLRPAIASQPIHGLLLCILMGMLVTDVAVRRIHWDAGAIKHWAFVGVAAVQGFLTTRKIDAAPTLAALRTVHDRSVHGRAMTVPVIDREMSRVVKCEKPAAKVLTQSCLSSLKAAKQRAIEEIRAKEKGESTNRTNLHE